MPEKVVPHGLSDSQLRDLATRANYILEESSEEPPFALLSNAEGNNFLSIIKKTTRIKKTDRLLTLLEAWEMHENRTAMFFPD